MISIVIPCYEMAGRGVEMLHELMTSIRSQTFSNYEIVVSDNSFLESIFELCNQKGARIVRGKLGAAANLNNAINCARGDIIKPVCQDDKFTEPDSLQKIEDAFSVGAQWVACKSQNSGDEGMRNDVFTPYPHRSIKALREGENTYGSPSVMAWRRNDLRLDENLHWLFDCEFYGRMADKHGVPTFIDTPIYIRQWSGMATLTVATGAQRIADLNYVKEKYHVHEFMQLDQGDAFCACGASTWSV